MESITMQISEMFDFMTPFCSAAMRKQAAFESAPIVKPNDSAQTLATETDMTAPPPSPGAARTGAAGGLAAAPSSSFAQVQYLSNVRCDTSLTSSLSEDEMLLPYDPSITPYYPLGVAGPVPQTVTFFTPQQETVKAHSFSHLSLQWHVKRSAGGFKGIDEWTGRLCEVADARQDDDTGGYLGYVTCYRISPSFVLPANRDELRALEDLHPTLAALSQYMKDNTTLDSATIAATSPYQDHQQALFGLPLVLLTHVEVAPEYRGVGLGLLLVDETCRCLANPAQWVLIDDGDAAASAESCSSPSSLRDYFGLLGFTPSGLLKEGQVIIRWNDPYCMAAHRYEDLCPHLPRVAIQ